MAFDCSLRLGGELSTPLTKQNLHLAYVVQLPFRLRLPAFQRYELGSKGDVEIAFRNKYLDNTPEPPGGSHTEAVMLLPTPDLAADKMAHAQSLLSEEQGQYVRLGPRFFSAQGWFEDEMYKEAQRGLRLYLQAYDQVSQKADPVYVPHDADDTHAQFAVLLTTPVSYQISDEDIHTLFGLLDLADKDKDWRRYFAMSGRFSISSNAQYSADVLASIDKALKQQERHAFYEFATESRKQEALGEHRIAFLMAMIAFEGVHGAFVAHCLERRDPDNPQNAQKLASLLLSDQGVYKLNSITPILFMDPDERPTEEEIKKCNDAISVRNALMHSNRTPKGEYKLRTHTETKYIESREAVMKVYARYLEALERREEQQATPDPTANESAE